MKDISPQSGARLPVIAGLFVALIAVLLVGGWYAGQHFRARVGIEPAAGASMTSGAAPATAQVAAPAAVGAASSAAPTVASAAAASPSASAFRMATSPLEQEVEQAYLHYWDVRKEAFLNLDASLLGQVEAGAKLSRDQQQVEDFKAQGHAARLDVDHRIAIVKADPSRAIVYDEYLNKSVFVDAATKQDIPTASPPATEKISVDLQKMDGVWKVVDGAQHD
jgi:galactokinase